MKILQISSAVNFGGERHLLDLCKGLTERGHEVFAAVRPNDGWLERLYFLPPENILKLPLRNTMDVFSAAWLARFIREREIDIAHAHAARDCQVPSLAVRFAPQTKLVLTQHIPFPIKFLQKYALSNVAKVIALSSAVEANLRKTFPAEKIVSVPDGIEIEKWAKAAHENLREAFRFEHNISFEALLIGIVSELKQLKGQEDFILAAQIVAGKFPESHFVIIGKDNSFDRSFRRKLKRMVKIFGLKERFLWLDWVKDTAKILHSMDVFVSAAHSESFSLSILEAMASGVPVVATETEGAKELIENGRTGKLVSIKEPVQLAEAIGKILSDENLRRTLGKNAQEIAKEKFDSERMTAETEKVYQAILK